MKRDLFIDKDLFRLGGKFLSDLVLNKLKQISKYCRSDILKMTTFASSDHPGGFLSSIYIYTI